VWRCIVLGQWSACPPWLMSAPPLRRNRLRWRYRLTHRRWWSHRRGSGAGHQHEDHQPASHKRESEHSQGKTRAAGARRWCAGHPRRILARRLALAGISPVVDASTGDGGRRVRSPLGIRAHPETTNADGSSYAGLGEVEPEWSEFEALTKSPCHVPAILPCQSHPARQVSEMPGPPHQRRALASVAPEAGKRTSRAYHLSGGVQGQFMSPVSLQREGIF
jgi:hypothetical protein